MLKVLEWATPRAEVWVQLVISLDGESTHMHGYQWPLNCSHCCLCSSLVFFQLWLIFFCWTQENTSFWLADITTGIDCEYLKHHPVPQGSDCSLSWLLLCSWSHNIYSLWVAMKNGPDAQLDETDSMLPVWLLIWCTEVSFSSFEVYFSFARDVIARPSQHDVISNACLKRSSWLRLL